MDISEGYALRSRRSRDPDSGPNQYTCQACDTQFATPQELAYHLFYGLSMTNDEIRFLELSLNIEQLCFPPDRHFQPCTLNSSPSVSVEKGFFCVKCSKSFKNEQGLNQHMGKIHSKDLKQSVCSVCHRRFKNKYALKFHQKQVHQKSTAVTCQVCGKKLYNKYLMKQHLKMHEDGRTSTTGGFME